MPLERVIFKASIEELEAWKELAWQSRLTLSAWIRLNLNDGGVFATSNGQIAPKPFVSPTSHTNDGSS